jgi:hypothetical protein
MSDETTETQDDRDEPSERSAEERRVLRWRFQQIRRLGMSHIEARLLAESGADLALVRRLIANGCSPTLALKIAL